MYVCVIVGDSNTHTTQYYHGIYACTYIYILHVHIYTNTLPKHHTHTHTHTHARARARIQLPLQWNFINSCEEKEVRDKDDKVEYESNVEAQSGRREERTTQPMQEQQVQRGKTTGILTNHELRYKVCTYVCEGTGHCDVRSMHVHTYEYNTYMYVLKYNRHYSVSSYI